MELAFERLIKFDLVEELEKSLLEAAKSLVLIDFLNTMQGIQSVDRFIKDFPSFPGSTDKIIRSELISAVGATLAIEGTRLAAEEIEESFRKADLNERLRRSEQEAQNSRQVYKFLVELVNKHDGKFVYSEQIVKQIHNYFTQNMNYMGNIPGEYRGEFTTTFGEPRREGLCRNRAEVETAMANFVDWLNQTGSGLLSGNMILKAIMAHYYLTEIHPFGDGNGRTARALEALVLCVHGMNSYCFWSLANFWSTYRDEYIAHLGNIRATCDPLDFAVWGMKGYLDEIRRVKGLVLRKVKQLMLMDYARYLLRNKNRQEIKINQRIINVLELLVRSKPMRLDQFQASVPVVALYSNISPATKSRDFAKMRQLGLIKVSQKGTTLATRSHLIEPNFQILEQLRY